MIKTFVALDLETTGLDPGSDRIIEIAAVKFRGKRSLATFQTLVSPQRPLPYRIQVLTGIAPAELSSAPTFSEVADGLATFLGDHPLVGQNLAFDLGFLASQGLRLFNPAYDTVELARLLLFQLADYSLASLARHLGIPFPVQHRALPDATAAKQVFLALLSRASHLDPALLAEINRLSAAMDWPLRPLFLEIEAKRKASGPGSEPAPPVDKEGRPLTPSYGKPLDVAWLTAILEPGGPLSGSLTGFEHRPQQVQMMQAVAKAINDGHHLIVEAGSGTGKSMAYLLPAIFFALHNNAPIVISTNTINLQEQLIHKDIPDLLRALRPLAPQLRWAQLKGRANYLCLRQWHFLRARPSLSRDEVRLLLRTLVWLGSTSTGDRGELNLWSEELPIWSRICAAEENCLAGQCPYLGQCFLHRARHQAERSHLIVVNHALLLSEVATGIKVLPDYRHLIIDEAHRLEDEATQQFGYQVAERDLAEHLNRFAQGPRAGLLPEIRASLKEGGLAPSRGKDIQACLQSLEQGLEACRPKKDQFFALLSCFVEGQAQDRGDYELRLRLSREMRRQRAWAEVERAWEGLSLSLKELDAGLGQLYAALEDLPEHVLAGYEGLALRLSALMRAHSQLCHRLSSIVANPTPDQVCWIQVTSGTVALCAAPLHVAQELRKSLFSKKDCVILASATLSIEGDFRYMKERLGLEEAEELLLGSPFDYSTSALVYIPEDIPEPDQAGYAQAVEQALVSLGRASRGQALALFTSHSALRATYSRIQARLEEEGILVLGQGLDGSPKQLLAAFKAAPQAVLMGTSSFWEGVDVVGGALSVLVIVRLPFSVPTDPVFEARSQLFEAPFDQYALPQSVLRFKQGFGRLIRSRSDRGIVVILDRRIQTRYYGAAFLNSLPPCIVKKGPLRHLPREAAAWLGIEREIS